MSNVYASRFVALFQSKEAALTLGMGRSLQGCSQEKQFLPTSRACFTTTSTSLCRSTQPVMLRASLRSSRPLSYTPSVANAGRQWHAIQAGRVASGGMVRALKNLKKVNQGTCGLLTIVGDCREAMPTRKSPVSPTQSL
jgi:hypothetical protein